MDKKMESKKVATGAIKRGKACNVYYVFPCITLE